MKNFERYEAEIKEAIEHNNAISVLAKLMNLKCGVVGLYDAINWLYEEYEPFTDDEKIILKNVDKKYSYIARDEDGSIQLFEVRPFKIDVTQGYYEADGTHYNFNCYKNIFSKITYKNGPVQFRSDEDE